MTLSSLLRAGVAALATAGIAAPAQAVELQWLGQAAVKITTDGGKVDLILVTHGHGDHVGDTAELAKMTGAKVGMNADMGHTFGTLGIVDYKQLIRFNKSGTIMPLGDGITVTMVRAEHSSELVHTDADG